MGQRTATETIARLVVAFLQEPTWKQKDLERHCEVSARAIRQRLLDLQAAGVPVEREEDRPHVYWSVPRGWFPGKGTAVDSLDHLLIARLVARLPKSQERERILGKLIAPAFGAPNAPSSAHADVPDDVLAVLEDGAMRLVPVRLGYYSASRGEHGIRVTSIQRIDYGPRTRFVAYCHASASLKWFRADRVTSPRLDPGSAYMTVEARQIDRFVADSLDGYRGSADAVACAFIVRPQEAHWVVRNLPSGGSSPIVEHQPEGARVALRTAAVEVLARFLVGLGGAVRDVEPAALRSRVVTLAREALLANGARLNVGPVRSIRPAQ